MKKLSLAILLMAAPSLVQTVRPDQVRGTAAVASPAGAQTVTQPVVGGVQTTLTVNSLNGMMNPLPFANADFGDKVNAAFAACHGAGTTVTPCTVKIPSGSYSYAHTINLSAFDTLEGSGVSDTTINFTGTRDASRKRARFFSATWEACMTSRSSEPPRRPTASTSRESPGQSCTTSAFMDASGRTQMACCSKTFSRKTQPITTFNRGWRGYRSITSILGRPAPTTSRI